jgi:tight adherence protein B
VRRRGVLLVLGLTAALAAGIGPARAQEEGTGVLIRRIDTSSFPTVTVTVAVQSDRAFGLGDVRLTENGQAVTPTDLRRLGPELTVDVVLALDTSRSMEGEPLAAAAAAARQFLEQAPDTIRVGLVTFDAEARVVAPPSTDRSVALAALASPTTRNGTALYDAVVKAAALFAGPSQRNIILLSDGRDVGSEASLQAAVDAARNAQAAVFAVALQGRNADFVALQSLASGTDGRYAEAAEADLRSLYADLLTQFSNQYLITYRSQAAAGSTLSLSVALPDGSDSAVVLAPLAPPPSPAPGGLRLPVLEGTWGLAVAVGLVFVSTFALGVMFLGTASRRRRERELARRMAAEATPEQLAQEGHRFLGALVPSIARAGTRVAEVGGFMGALERNLERAALPVSAGEFVALSTAAIVVLFLFGALFFGNVAFGVAGAVAGAALPNAVLAYAIRRRTKKLHEQLPDILMILASSLRAGHSFMQALDTVAKEIGDPGAKEFSRVIAEIRLGRPEDEALNAMAERVGSDDFRWAVMAVNIQREVGGNLAEILDTVAETVRERETIRRQIDTLSAEGKLSMYILIALPILIGLYLFKVSRDYMALLYTRTVGMVMLGVAGGLIVVGYLWMRKLVKIDV